MPTILKRNRKVPIKLGFWPYGCWVFQETFDIELDRYCAMASAQLAFYQVIKTQQFCCPDKTLLLSLLTDSVEYFCDRLDQPTWSNVKILDLVNHVSFKCWPLTFISTSVFLFCDQQTTAIFLNNCKFSPFYVHFSTFLFLCKYKNVMK